VSPLDDIDPSDEATGLPPLGELNEAGVPADGELLLLKGATSQGLVMLHDNAPIPVRYIHVRGLTPGGKPGNVDWAQVSIAIPEHLVPQIIHGLTGERID